MNDLEICQAIAKIENQCCAVNTIQESPFDDEKKVASYNPIADKAICFDLMVKYDVVFLDGTAYAGCIDGSGPECGGYYCHGQATDTNPQRAICLAIIDAHKPN